MKRGHGGVKARWGEIELAWSSHSLSPSAFTTVSRAVISSPSISCVA